MKKSSALLLTLLILPNLLLTGCWDDDDDHDDHDHDHIDEIDLDFDGKGMVPAEGEGAILSEPATEEVAAPAVEENTADAPTETPVEAAPVSLYKDGTYIATGPYMSPEGMDNMEITLTIADDVITGVSIKEMASNGESRSYIKKFAKKIGGEIIGVELSKLEGVGAIAGASLTAGGFNKALVELKAQAAS